MEFASKALLILIVSGFLGLIAGGAWKRTQMAVAPPIYDPISYYSKAELVWTALATGDLHGILNGPMAERPPGTALVLYPFGFRPSVRSFLFRSVFAPILIWAIGLTIPVAMRVNCWRDALLGSAVIIGLTTMPLFYQFEIDELLRNTYKVGNQWGLVDTLEGAIGGVAISILCFGISNKSKTWCALGWLAGAFSFFIKPSGLLVMLALAGVATVEFGILIFANHFRRDAVFKLAASVYFIGFCLFGIALWLAFGSDYMSREAISRAVKGQKFVIAIREGRELFAALALIVVPVVGWWWFSPAIFYTVSVVVESVQAIKKRRWSFAGARLGAAGVILVCALCWWILLAGQNPRYLFPFILMVVAWIIPDLFQRVRALGPSARGAAVAYCLAPALLLGGLLWSKQPPIIFQQLLGVNLSAGGWGSEVDQGRWLLGESERLLRPLKLYSLGEYGTGVVEMVDWVRSIENNNSPHRFLVKRPLNWVDPPGLRAEQIIQSDFLLLENVRSEVTGEATPVTSWPDEVDRFKQFAYSQRGVDQNGLELAWDGTVKLMRVADRYKFSSALYRWANSIQWKDDFQARNKAFLETSPQETTRDSSR